MLWGSIMIIQNCKQMDQFLNNFIQVNRDLYTEIEDTEHTGLEEIVDDCISRIGKTPEQMEKNAFR